MKEKEQSNRVCSAKGGEGQGSVKTCDGKGIALEKKILEAEGNQLCWELQRMERVELFVELIEIA